MQLWVLWLAPGRRRRRVPSLLCMLSAAEIHSAFTARGAVNGGCTLLAERNVVNTTLVVKDGWVHRTPAVGDARGGCCVEGSGGTKSDPVRAGFARTCDSPPLRCCPASGASLRVLRVP